MINPAADPGTVITGQRFTVSLAGHISNVDTRWTRISNLLGVLLKDTFKIGRFWCCFVLKQGFHCSYTHARTQTNVRLSFREFLFQGVTVEGFPREDALLTLRQEHTLSFGSFLLLLLLLLSSSK